MAITAIWFATSVFHHPKAFGFWTGVSWGDYNRDGYLDLYICGYVKYKPGQRAASTKQFGLEVPFTLNPASYEPERNLRGSRSQLLLSA